MHCALCPAARRGNSQIARYAVVDHIGKGLRALPNPTDAFPLYVGAGFQPARKILTTVLKNETRSLRWCHREGWKPSPTVSDRAAG